MQTREEKVIMLQRKAMNLDIIGNIIPFYHIMKKNGCSRCSEMTEVIKLRT